MQTVPIGSDGSFELTNVPSPSVYDLVVTKTGYATSTQRIDVGAGEDRTGVEITLRKGDGVISGAVNSAAGRSAASRSPRPRADRGHHDLADRRRRRDLHAARPAHARDATRSSRARPGFASQTMTLTLAEGQKLTGVALTLGKSSGSLTGVVTAAARPGIPAAGVAVTVTDGEHDRADRDREHRRHRHLEGRRAAVPGTYTVTFTRGDLASQTLSVSLDAAGTVTPGLASAPVTLGGIAVTMQSATAMVTGIVTQPGGGNGLHRGTNALGEASVDLNSGSTTYSGTTAASRRTAAGTGSSTSRRARTR